MVREIREIKVSLRREFLINRYRKYFFALVAFLVVIVICISFLPSANNSLTQTNKTIGLRMSKSRLTLTDETILYVNLNTQGNAVNAVGIHIQVDPGILQIESIDSESSFCTLYAKRNFDTSQGVANLECGKPNPGFTGQNLLETIHLKAIKYGNSDIMVSTTSKVLKNDGHATNILTDFDKTSVSVILSQ